MNLRLPDRLALTRPQQRLVVIVVLALLIFSFAMRRYQGEPPRLAPPPVSPPPVEEETPNEQE